MRNLKWIAGFLFVAALTALSFNVFGEGTNSAASSKPIPYPLDHCVVSGDKLGGDMGPPIVFIYQTNGINQEIKFCCPMCKPDFLKNPDKYMKIIKAAEADTPPAQK